jgi:hypothetical protein
MRRPLSGEREAEKRRAEPLPTKVLVMRVDRTDWSMERFTKWEFFAINERGRREELEQTSDAIRARKIVEYYQGIGVPVEPI